MTRNATFTLIAVALVLLLTVGIAEAASLEAHYALDETSGQTAFDSTPNSLDGTLGSTGGVDTSDPLVNQPGVIGTAYDFSLADLDRVDLSSHVGSFADDTTGAISGWFRTTSTSRIPLLHFGESSTADRLLIEMGAVTPGEFRFIVREAGVNSVDLRTSATFNDGAWHHFAVTQDGSAATMFIDGTEITSFAMSTNSGSWFDTVTSVDVMALGFETRSGGDFSFDGPLDDMAIWDQTLSDGEAIALFELGDEVELEYNASQADALFDVHAAGAGFTTIDGLRWTFIDGLSGSAGSLIGSGGNFILQLDGDSGVQSRIIPEPGTLALFSIAGLLCARRRRGNKCGT